MNRQFAIIGRHLPHTLSPQIHQELFKLSRINGNYNILEIEPDTFKFQYNNLKALDGFNITIPYKEKIIDFCDRLDDSAKMYMSVNCVSTKNGISTGYNTDAAGFLKALDIAKIPLNKNVLLLGCGGAGRMMAIEAVKAGANLTIAVRNQSHCKALKVIDEIKIKFPDSCCEIVDISDINGTYNTILNSTPVGMYPDIEECPVSEDIILKCDHVFDAIYNPYETKLINFARKNNKNAVGGMAMLVWQAVISHEIWDNTSFDEDEIDTIIKNMQKIVKKVL